MYKAFVIGWLVTFAPALHLPLAAQDVNIGHRVAPDVAVSLVGPFSHLRVIGWRVDSVSVTGYMAQGYRLENVFAGDPGVPSRGAKLYIDGPEAVTPKSAILELRVPMNARVSIKGGSSTLEVSGVSGDLNLNMVGGRITVTGSPRTLQAEGIDASITVDGSPDYARLRTAAGDIVMRGGSTDASFTTVSGNVTVSGGTLERGRFESVSGSLNFAGDLTRAASLLFDSHSGAINLQLTPKLSARIDAETMGGAIDNLLSNVRPAPRRDGRGQEISLDVGLGGSSIVIRSFKGNVLLSRRP